MIKFIYFCRDCYHKFIGDFNTTKECPKCKSKDVELKEPDKRKDKDKYITQ